MIDRMIRKSVFASLAVISGLALSNADAREGGDADNNGGNAVVCLSPEGRKTVELLDFFEARQRSMQISLGDPLLSLDEKIKIIAKRIARLEPVRAQLFEDQYRVSKSNPFIRILPGIRLINTNDSHLISLPLGCTLEQIAVQKKTHFPEDPWITISQDLWDLLDNDNKAGLLVHEFLLSESLENGKTDSFNVRYLTAAFASKTSENWSAREFEYFSHKSGLFRLPFRKITDENAVLTQGLEIILQQPNRQTYRVLLYYKAEQMKRTAILNYQLFVFPEIPLSRLASITLMSLDDKSALPPELFVTLPFEQDSYTVGVLILDHWNTIIRSLALEVSALKQMNLPLDFIQPY